MKIFAKFLMLLLCAVITVGLASCDVIEGLLGNQHQHTFGSDWSKDETYHWHAATCEHSDEVADKAEHAYKNGVCVCGAEEPKAPHEHNYTANVTAPTCTEAGFTTYTCECGDSYVADNVPADGHGYSDEWSKDADKHWHAATCEHSDEVADEAEHIYENGVCICGAEEPEAPHEHTYSDAWSKDETKHWHAATCEHTDEVADEAEHIYENGVCICGEEEPAMPHEHTYSSVWSYDANGHWHASTCGHDVKSDEASHTLGTDYKCACGYQHEHTYADGWSYDANGHWHASTCGHDVKSDEASHTLGTDYKCECGFAHEHTYSAEWSYDENTHWHASTCGHDVRGDEAPHFIEGEECAATCGYKFDIPHEHSFSSKWSSDEHGHWHAATCEHSDLRSDEGEHSIDGGICAVCGFISPISIKASDIEQGGWAYGVKKTNAKRIRTSELIPVKAGTVIKYDPNGFQICLDLATAPDASTGERAFWLTEAGEYVVQTDAYLGVTVAVIGGGSNITPSQYACDIVIYPGTGEVERTYDKVNVYRFGGEGNDWCFVYLPEGYDPDRSEPYPFVIANHGNGWNMDGSAKKANWTDWMMYMSASEIAKQSASKQSRFIATEDESLWYSNPTIEAFLAAGYIVCGAQNYGDNLYGNDNCTNAVVDFFNHMVATYNVESACHMIGASNGAMTTLNAVPKLGDKIKSIIIQYPLTCLISHYLSGQHRDQIEEAYGLDQSKTYTKDELEALISDYDVLYKDVVDGVKQGYFPAIKIYYSMTDTLTTANANALPLIEMLERSGVDVEGVQVDADGGNKNHGHPDHFDPEAYVEWFETHR